MEKTTTFKNWYNKRSELQKCFFGIGFIFIILSVVQLIFELLIPIFNHSTLVYKVFYLSKLIAMFSLGIYLADLKLKNSSLSLYQRTRSLLAFFSDIIFEKLLKPEVINKFSFLSSLKNLSSIKGMEIILIIIGAIIGILIGNAIGYFFLPNIATYEIPFLPWVTGIFTGIHYNILFTSSDIPDILGIIRQIKTVIIISFILGGVAGATLGKKLYKKFFLIRIISINFL